MIANDPAVVWHLPAFLRGRLLGPEGLRLAEWLESGAATVVKDALHRTIYRVVLDDLDFHLKEYRTVGARGRIRELCRPVKARAEFQRGLPAALGVPAPKPLGWGVLGPTLAPQASFLITETVVDAQPLLHLLAESLDPAARQRLAVALGVFLARLHGAGVVHRDLHPGNLLARLTPSGEPELFLIDLHEVRVGTPSPWRVRRLNLIVFNRFFVLRATRSDRLRFWRAYTALAGDAVPDHPTATPQALDEATWKSNARFWTARDRRPVGFNRLFRAISLGDYHGHALRDAAIEPLLADPEAALMAPDVRVLKDGGSSRVVEFSLPDGRPVVLKRFNKRSLVEMIKNRLRASPAMRSWVMGHGLIDGRVPTALPLAVVHRRRYGLPAEGYLLTEKLEDAVDLRAFVDGLADLPADRARQVLWQRLDAVAKLLRTFHRRSLGHRDLKAANLLTAADHDDVRTWFVDLVGVRRRSRTSRKARVRDLARLSASFHSHPGLTHTDKLRFLRTYLSWSLRGNSGWKRWWRELGDATAAKVARNARQGRPVG